MEKRPTECPICGNRIVKITNAVTKNSYFKCSNKECHFVLGNNFTKAEFYLQGRTLNKTCLKCHNPLEVANGPHGLYARCFKCDCDMRPTTYNGKTYQKWANAHKLGTQEEINTLIKNFNAKEVVAEDKMYDFETFISEETNKTSKNTEDTNCTKILELLCKDTETPLKADQISERTGIKIGSVRTSLLMLRSLELVKIVGYIPNVSGNHTLLYQTVDSKLPEIKTYSKEDGYNTIASFLKDNVDKYGSVVRAKEVLTAALRKSSEKPVLFHTSRGICSGYPVALMASILDKQPVQTHIEFKKENPTEPLTPYKGQSEMKQEVLKMLQKDTRVPFTMSQIAEKLRANKCYIRATIRDLRQSKKLKVVGWKYAEGKRGATPLQYQVAESPLPKFKTTVDNNAYATFKQFYKKKLRGKRVTSVKKAEMAIKDLPIIPLIINQRAYVGYSVADLKKTFKAYIESPKSSPVKEKVKNSSNINIKAIDTLTKINRTRGRINPSVSNPITKKKSFFSTITSFFKKEKVHS